MEESREKTNTNGNCFDILKFSLEVKTRNFLNHLSVVLYVSYFKTNAIKLIKDIN